jgi:DNA-binding MarR family transcriptional regulator
VDRRAVRVRLTDKGRHIRSIIAELFRRHASGIMSREVLGGMRLADINASLRRMEHYWTDQIRYIY